MTRRLLVDADALAGLLEAATVARDPATRQALAALVRTVPDPEPSPWVTVSEAAALLRMSERSVRRACAAGHLQHLRIGRRIVIARTAVTPGPDRTGTRPAYPPTGHDTAPHHPAKGSRP